MWMMRVQRHRVHLTEGGGRSAAVIVLVSSGGTAVGSCRFHHLWDLGLDQTRRRERGAAMRPNRHVVIQRARTRRPRHAIRHATRAAAQTTIRSRAQVQIKLRHAAIEMTKQPLLHRRVHWRGVARDDVWCIEIAAHLKHDNEKPVMQVLVRNKTSFFCITKSCRLDSK